MTAVSFDFKRRVAVITGGAQGIGLAVAKRLSSSGARVSVWDRSDARLAQVSKDHGFHAARTDVGDSESVRDAARSTEQALGPIHYLVNCAAVVYPERKTWETEEHEWLATLNVNLVGTWRCCKEVAPGMMRQAAGVIVNMASMAGKNGNVNMSHYSASKAGVINLTKVLGRELAASGVRVHCVTPAVIATEGLRQVSDEQIKLQLREVPMQRAGRPEEVAALVAWLLCDECSFTTGAAWDISGGRAVY